MTEELHEVLDTGVTGRTYHAVAHLNFTGVHGRSDVDDDADTLDGPVQVSRIEQVADHDVCHSCTGQLFDVTGDVERANLPPGPHQGADHAAPCPSVRRITSGGPLPSSSRS